MGNQQVRQAKEACEVRIDRKSHAKAMNKHKTGLPPRRRLQRAQRKMQREEKSERGIVATLDNPGRERGYSLLPRRPVTCTRGTCARPVVLT